MLCFVAIAVPLEIAIKLDVEGLEMKAFEGAKQTIQRHKPVIVAAVYHRPGVF